MGGHSSWEGPSAEPLKQAQGLDLIAIETFQLLSPVANSLSKAWELKAAARELDVALVCTMPLTPKEIAHSGTQLPDESLAADVTMTIWPAPSLRENLDSAGVSRVKVSTKTRGEIEIRVAWLEEQLRYANLVGAETPIALGHN